MNNKYKTILITGAAGMIGSATVQGLLSAGYRVIGLDRKEFSENIDGYTHCVVDLANKEELESIIIKNRVERIIHLAALAHSVDGKEYSWDDYYHLNVECAKSVFDAAGQIPVLFVSTVDVFGFTKGTVNVQTEPHPVSYYAKSKAMAEEECRKLLHYTIFRFSPVYTDTIKRDIQKRYYLKYPSVAYKIGKGTEYEILNIKKAISAMIAWCGEEAKNDVHIIKDAARMHTNDYIKREREAGRAKFVLWLPKWLVSAVYFVLKGISGENKYTYLLSKAIDPLRTE